MVRGWPYYKTALPGNEKTPCAAEKQCSVQTNATTVSRVSLLWKWYSKYLLWAWMGEKKERRLPCDGAVAVHSYRLGLAHLQAVPPSLSLLSERLLHHPAPGAAAQLQTNPTLRERLWRGGEAMVWCCRWGRCCSGCWGTWTSSVFLCLCVEDQRVGGCYHIAGQVAVTAAFAWWGMQWKHSPSQTAAEWKALSHAGYKLYVMVCVSVENVCNNTYCNCNDIVAVFGLGKSIINRVYCWCISTVFANSRSHSEL